jgi:hypothetical protein
MSRVDEVTPSEAIEYRHYRDRGRSSLIGPLPHHPACGQHRAVGMVEVVARVASYTARARGLSTRRSWLPRCQTHSGFTLTGILASFTSVHI